MSHDNGPMETPIMEMDYDVLVLEAKYGLTARRRARATKELKRRNKPNYSPNPGVQQKLF